MMCWLFGRFSSSYDSGHQDFNWIQGEEEVEEKEGEQAMERDHKGKQETVKKNNILAHQIQDIQQWHKNKQTKNTYIADSMDCQHSSSGKCYCYELENVSESTSQLSKLISQTQMTFMVIVIFGLSLVFLQYVQLESIYIRDTSKDL